MSGHAKLAPSGASTWMNCPASVRASQGVPDEESEWAYEGTVMHEVRAWALLEGASPLERVGDLMRVGAGRLLSISQARASALAPGIEWLRDLFGGADLARARYRHIEGKMFFDWNDLANVYGTVDFAGLRDDGVLVLSDLKFGMGVPVWPTRNKQQMIYALLTLHNMPSGDRKRVTKVVIHIDQPRIAGAGGLWETTPDDLFRWLDRALLPAVEATEQRNPTFRPSAEACRWCKARARCPERAAWVQENAKFAAMMRRDPRRASGALSTEALVAFVDAEQEIKEALAEARAFLIEDYHAGRKVPGKKVVLAQDGHRAWIDKENAERVLTTLLDERAFTRALISPAEAEKRLPRQHHAMLADICAKPPPAPKLVSEHDKRAPMRSLKNRFKDER